MNFKIHHYAISVADLDQTLDWYARHLGFTLVRRFGFPEAKTQIAHITANGIMLEILQYEGATSSPDTGRDPFEVLSVQGSKHIAFEVDDAAFGKLKASGVHIEWEPVTVPPT